MDLASASELADWLRANQDKRNTPDYQTVLRGFQEARLAELRTSAPAAPTAQPESGFIPALKAGATELGGSLSALAGKIGLKDEAKAQEEYEAAQKRAREIFKPTEEGWMQAPVTKFTELLGGSLPYMAAPLAAGVAAGALPLTGLAATAAGLGAAGLTSAGQFTATNLARQMEEGKKLSETDLGAAALAAVPQAALDTLSMRMIPGIGKMFGDAGVKITAETAKDIAEQGLKKTLTDYTLKTGKTAGIEGLTESAQQVFERLQAGLSITDEKARQEYFDNFIGGAVLGGTLSVPGRYVERGREQREARGLLAQQEADQRAAEKQAEEARKQDPAYLMQVSQEYAALEAQKKALQSQIVRGTKEQPLDEAAKQANRAISEQLAELAPDLRAKAAEFNKLGGKDALAKLQEQQRVAALSPLEYQMEQMGIKPPAPPAEEPATPEEAAALRGEAPEAIAPEVSYAQMQLDFAKRQGAIQALDPDEQRNLNVAFLMQDPAMAQQLLKERPALPDMNRKERDTIFSALALQLGTGKQVTPGSLADVIGTERETRAAAQAALEEKLGKEREALERIKATPEYLRNATQETVTARAEDAQRAELSRQLTSPVQEQRNLFADTELANAPAAPSLAETVAKTMQQPLPPLDQAIMGQYAKAPTATEEAPGAVTRTFVKAPDQAKLAQMLTTALQKDIPANDRALLEKLDANIDAYARDPAAVESAVDFIYKRLLLPSQGMPFTQKETIDPAKDIKERLQLLDQAKLSETEQATQLARRRLTEEEQQSLYGTSLGPRAQTGVVEGELGKTVADFTKQAKIGTPVREATDEILRAVQGELPFTDRRGEPVAQTATSFGNWKEFQNYLSSEGLQMLRAAQADLMGTATPQVSQINKPQTEAMVRQPVKLGAYPNVHRASVLVRDMLNRAEEVRQKVSALAAERQALVAQPERDATASQQLLNEAKAALTKLTSTDVWETIKGDRGEETRYAGKWDTALLNRVQAAKTKVDAAQRMRDQLMAQVQSNLDSFTNQINEYEKATAPTVTDKDALMLQYEAQGEKARGAAKKAALTARDQLKGTVDNLIAHQRWLSNAQKAVNFIDDSTPPAEKAFRLRKLNELLGIEKQLRNTVTQQYNQFMGQVQQSFAAPNLKPSLPDRTFKNFLVEEAKLTDLINQNNRALGGLKLNLYNAKTALNQAYVAAEQSKAEDLLKVRNNLLAAEKLDREMRAVLTERREQANAPELVQPQQALAAEAGQLETKARKAQRASQRLAAAARPTNVGVGETQAQREARDAAQRKEEQARLERMEEPVAGPVTEPAGVYAEKGLGAQQKEGTPVQREQILMGVRRSIRQEIQDKTDKLAALREIAEDPDSTLDERVEATNEFAKLYKESHGKLERLDARIGNALKKQDAIVAKIKEVRDTLAQPSVLTDKQQERYKNKPEELETREANQRDKLQTQLSTLFTELNKATTFLSEKRGIERVVVPTKAERAAPREVEEDLTPAGERIAQTQTTSRQTGPLTKKGAVPPTQLRTGTAESRAGTTRTGSRNVPQEPGKFADALIAKLSKTRAELDTVKNQLEFIEKNPSKTAEGAAKQTAAKAKLTDEKQRLESLLADLRGEQTKVSAEEAKVQAELRKGEEVSERGEKEFDLRAGDVELSRGKPVEGLTVAQVTEELERALGQKGLLGEQNVVTIVGSVADLKKRKISGLSKAQLADIPDDAKGFVYNGKAYLIAENIGAGHSLGVLLHEVGAHIGFRNFFNKAQYTALVETVKRWGKMRGDSLEARIGRAAQERVEAAETKAEQVDDELLAYAVEEAFNAGVEPAGVKSGSAVANWLRSIVNAFKSVLAKFGVNPTKLKVGDLVNLAYGAANLELRGTWHGTGKPFTEFDFKYMGKGEGAQVYGWGTYRAQAPGVAKYYQQQEAEKLLDEWRTSPEIKKWLADLRDGITFDGKTILELGKEKSPAYKKVANLLAEMAKKNNYETAPGDLARDALDYELARSSIMTKEEQKEAKKILEAIEDGDIKVRMPFQAVLEIGQRKIIRNTYYKNHDRLTEKLFGNTTAKAVNMVLYNIRRDYKNAMTQADFEKALDASIAEEISSAEYLSNVPEYKDRLEVLKSLNKDDFVFFPPPPPPVAPPKGAFARVMSTTPDEQYYMLDLPLKKQTAYIQQAIEDMQASGRTEKGKAKLKSILENEDIDAEVRVEELESLLRRMPVGEEPRTREDVSMLLRSFGIAGYKYLDGKYRGRPITRDSKFNYVDFYDKDEGPAIVAWDIDRIGQAEGVLFSRARKFTPETEVIGRVSKEAIATPKSFIERVKPNLIGLGFRTQFVDKLAPIEQVARGMADAVKASQMMYYLRMYDQRMNFTSQAVGMGAPQLVEKKRKDGQTERVLEATKGANIKDIVKILSAKDVQKAVGGVDEANDAFTMYLAAKRAERVGVNALNFSGNITQADLDAVVDTVENNPVLKKAFGEARDLYNQYNRDLVNFAAQTGALSKADAKTLLASNDYIPYYRVREGNAALMIGGETPIRIGNLKDSPHLEELVGGTEKIMGFLDSSVLNTSMLLDMSLRNIAVKNSMYELHELGLVTTPKQSPERGAPKEAVTFKKDGVEYYVLPKEDKLKEVGIPADLLVKGLAGIPTMFPAFMRVMGMPSRFLRRLIVASPPYIAKALFRDSLAAFMMSGSDATPVLGALKQIGKESVLERRGVTGGQVFTGMPEDMSRLLREMQEGRPGWSKTFSWLEAKSMEADALTRKAQYESYIKQGLSEMEATLMSLESMNFSRRGLSPSVHMATTLIPFMHSQIQSLDVMYRTFRGRMPFNDRLALRERMITSGMALAAMTLAYAAAMQDDETYKNATPDQKYGNWFVRVPFLDQYNNGAKVTLRVPIPFELGYIFKALPEAIYNTLATKHGGEEAAEAFKQIALQLIPGGTSYGIPQAVKPLIEVGLGKSFYTGRDIESAQEQAQMPGTRYRDNTSEAAKLVGQATNISPIKIEALVNGYTGSMGLALLQSLNVMLPQTGPDKAAKRLSDMPVVGPLFQPEDASGIIDATYKALQEATQVRASYKSLIDKGEYGKAQALIQGKLDELSLNAIAGKFKQQMGELTKAERAIKGSSASEEEKRKSLDAIRQIKIQIASSVRAVVDRTKSPEVPA